MVGAWTSCRLQVSFHVPSVALDWAAIVSSATAASTVHKKCSVLKCLTKDPDYRCTRCLGTACHLDDRPQREVQVGPDKLEVVASLCYLGDTLSAAGGCELQRSCYQFSLLTTSLSRHMAVCTALVCRAQCSLPVRLGH